MFERWRRPLGRLVPAGNARRSSQPIFLEQNVKKLILLILAARMIFAAMAVVAETAAQKYTCIMHPEVLMDQPGECPKCGMALVVVEKKKKRLTPNTQRLTPTGEGNDGSEGNAA